MLRNFKKLFILPSLLFVLLIAGCAVPQRAAEPAKTMSVKEKVEAAGFQLVDFEYVKGKVGKGLRNFEEVVIIDARPGRKYESGHIPGAINIHDNQFNEHYPRLESLTGVTKSTEIIVYCGGFNCVKSYHVAKMLKEKGYKNVKVYLAGMPDWSKKSYVEISDDYAVKLYKENATFVDARPIRKFEDETIPEAVSIPDTKFKFMKNQRQKYLDKLPVDKKDAVVVFCGGFECVKSHTVSGILVSEYGYENVYNYSAGLPGWKKNGHPTTKTGGTIEKSVKKDETGALKEGKEEGTVDKEYFKTLIDKRSDNIHIVDVRSPEEFKQGHVKGAINIHVNDVYKKGCDAVINKLPEDGNIVFMCSAGGRSSEMYYALQDMCGYKQMDRLYYLDAHVDYSSGKCEIE